MSKLRIWMVAAGVCLGLCSASAQDTTLTENDLVTVRKHKAHPTRMLARLADPVGENAATAAFQGAGVSVVNRISIVPGLLVLQIQDEQGAASVTPKPIDPAQHLLDTITSLQQSGHFAYVEPDFTVWATAIPNDAAFNDGRLWGLRNTGQGGGRVGADIHAEEAWDITTGSTDVIVAVIDSGILYNHQELITQMWRDPSVTNRTIYGTNAAAGTSDPLDDNGHGTHVAGTIGAAANDGTPHVGVAWKVQLMGCKFLTAQGFGQTAAAIGCIDFAVAKGARIMNNSWGGGARSQALEDSIVASRNKGVLFVAAAGNSANNNDVAPAYPCTYPVDNIISVAALDRRDLLADFSNYGLTTVHVGAPGVSIFSCWSTTDRSYNTIDGTSMASPHVAGVAALILAKYPTAGLLELRERILLGVDRVPALVPTTTTGGRVNAYRSLTLAPDGQMEIAITPLNNSILLAGSTELMLVKVTDVLSITNATVTATAPGIAPITFRNNGQAPDVQAGDATYSANFNVPTNIGPIAMKFVVTAPGETNSTNVLNYTIVPRPANDNFSGAAKVGAQGSITNILTNNRFASVEPGEPLHARVPTSAASLWWSFSPAASGRVFVDTSGSSFDTLLAVYTGNSVSQLSEVNSVDDVGTRVQGYLNFTALAGTTYRIAVAGYDDTSFGAIRLRVEPNGSPDTNAPIVALTTPPSGSVVTNKSVTLRGTVLDPVPNASGIADVQVRVNQDPTAMGASITNGNWSVNSLLQEGENTFQIVAIDFAGNQSTPIVANINYRVADPLNDLLVNAIDLPGNSGTVSGSSLRATKETDEPFHAGNDGGHSVWWRWQAPANGVLQLTTTNSNFDTLLAVYTGERVNALTAIDSNDDAFDGSGFSKLALTVQAGQTYRIAVDGYGGLTGSIKLGYAFTAVPLYSVTASATAGGTVAASVSGNVASNTVVRFTATPNTYFIFAGWEGSSTSTNNPLELVVTNDLAVTGRFVERPFSDGFEQGNLTQLAWTTGGNAPWSVQSGQVSFGRFAARSGTITHGQSSSLILTARFKAGFASFQYRVSSEEGWDALEFFLNGNAVRQWSGKTDWQTFSFIMPEGENTLEWRYVKDSTNTEGEDAAYLDNLDLPLMEPKIFDQPISLVRVAGETAAFSISAIANVPVTFRWQFNGTNLSDGGRVTGALTRALTITGVSTNDAGQYAVVVTAPGGATKSDPATLSILLPPEIVAAPTNTVVQEGGAAQFEVQADGQQLAYQWQRAGTNIAGATTRTLRLNPVTTADAGAYTVRVSNRAGFRTATATLTVNTIPPSVSLVSDGAGQFRIQFEGIFGQSVSVQASQNLTNWITIGNPVISSNNVPFTDPDAAAHAFRFYRITIP